MPHSVDAAIGSPTQLPLLLQVIRTTLKRLLGYIEIFIHVQIFRYSMPNKVLDGMIVEF